MRINMRGEMVGIGAITSDWYIYYASHPMKAQITLRPMTEGLKTKPNDLPELKREGGGGDNTTKRK